MPRRTPHDINTEPCVVCGKVIRYKADIPRHMRLHSVNKAALMHKCPYEGCDYQNLQKSNVKTHSLTHTGEQPYACPDCTGFRTADPGSLTRHRKKVHGYVPKQRNKATVTAATTKKSRRHAPYPARDSSVESSSSSGSSSYYTCESSDQIFDLSPASSPSPPLSYSPSSSPSTKQVADAFQPESLFTYTWDKDTASLYSTQLCVTPEDHYAALASTSVPYHLFPATESMGQFEHDVHVQAAGFAVSSSPGEVLSDLTFDEFDALFAESPLSPEAGCAGVAVDPVYLNMADPGQMCASDQFGVEVPPQPASFDLCEAEFTALFGASPESSACGPSGFLTSSARSYPPQPSDFPVVAPPQTLDFFAPPDIFDFTFSDPLQLACLF